MPKGPVPVGTVTFLFTDIVGSTKLWEKHGQAMQIALARHDLLLSEAVTRANGTVFKTIGDSCCAAFAFAPDAVSAALTAQLAIASEPWPAETPIKVRMAIHSGAVESRDDDYFGPPVNRVARLLSTGHGDQVLLSAAAQELVRDDLPEGAAMKGMGQHRLKDLGRPETIFQLLHPSLPSEFPPIRSLDNPELRHNLPPQLTSFVGREAQIAEVRGMLEKTRLLTLTGSGGAGKTRLALQVAADMLDERGDGVWLAELAPLTDAALVASTVAAAVGVREDEGKTILQSLTGFLKQKTLLLVLDNCEHLLDAAARLANELLRQCPGVRILTTSREALGISGETAYRIPSLSLPDPRETQTAENLSHYEAVRLFIDRAVQAQTSFAVTNGNAPALASVCLRLDGIPLAIELAAARARNLTLEEIDSRLDRRFQLLTGGSRTALPRQQTLRSLIDWSYDLLTETEKALLCRLSVFAGGWTLDAAEAVCSGEPIEDWETLDLLASLVDKSLVLSETSGASARYRLLETVRQYARERLLESGGSEAVRDRHRDYFLALAEDAEPKLQGPQQGEWLDRFDVEHDNLRSALEWSLAQEAATDKGLRLCGALSAFWLARVYLGEGAKWCARVLSLPEGPDQAGQRARVLMCAGQLSYFQGDYSALEENTVRGLALYREIGDQEGVARGLYRLGHIAGTRCDNPAAQAHYKASLIMAREVGWQLGVAGSLIELGHCSAREADFASAGDYFNEGLVVLRELGAPGGIALGFNGLAFVAHMQGDLATAQAYGEEIVALFRKVGNLLGLPNALKSLAKYALARGETAAARNHLEEAIAICKDHGDSYVPEQLIVLGDVSQAEGDLVAARAHLENALAMLRKHAIPEVLADSLSSLGYLAQAEGEFTAAHACHEEAFAVRERIGFRRGIADAHYFFGLLAQAERDFATARVHYRQALEIRREIGNREGIARSLESFAALMADTGTPERAAELWGAAEALREAMGIVIPPIERGLHDSGVADVRRSLGEKAFAATWANGRAITQDEAVDLALFDPSQ